VVALDAYGKLTVDVQNARIYTVPDGIFLVSPAIFKKFVENIGAKSSWEHVQKRFLKLKLHTKTPDGFNVHKLEANGSVLHGIIVAKLTGGIIKTTL